MQTWGWTWRTNIFKKAKKKPSDYFNLVFFFVGFSRCFKIFKIFIVFLSHANWIIIFLKNEYTAERQSQKDNDNWSKAEPATKNLSVQHRLTLQKYMIQLLLMINSNNFQELVSVSSF